MISCNAPVLFPIHLAIQALPLQNLWGIVKMPTITTAQVLCYKTILVFLNYLFGVEVPPPVQTYVNLGSLNTQH